VSHSKDKTPPTGKDGGASDTSTTASGTDSKGSTPGGVDQPMWVYVPPLYGHTRGRFIVHSVYILGPARGVTRPPHIPADFEFGAVEGIVNLEAEDGTFWSVNCRRRMTNRLLERLGQAVTLILYPQSKPQLPMGYPVPDHLLPPSTSTGGAP